MSGFAALGRFDSEPGGVLAAVGLVLILLLFIAWPTADNMFLFAALGFPHSILGFYRQLKKGTEVGRMALLLAVSWYMVLTLPVHTNLGITVSLIFIHYFLDSFFIFAEKVSFAAVGLIVGFLTMSLEGARGGAWLRHPSAAGLYSALFVGICIWQWRRPEGRRSRAFAELFLIGAVAGGILIFGEPSSLAYLYLPIGSLHYFNWYVSLENHFKGNEEKRRAYRHQLLPTAMVCITACFVYYYSERSPLWLEYFFGMPYFCIWINTHILANFRVSQIARVIPALAR